ncbi:unnamed protein product [Rhodiola kirilowii]
MKSLIIKLKNKFFCVDIIKCALASTKESSVPVSIMESKAEILIAVDIHSPLFPCSLMLLVDQLDNASKLVQLTAANIIHRACSFHKKGGIKRILPEVGHIQSELLNHLSVKLHSKPKLITEFAEAVIGTDTKDLVRKMMPEVLPKLAVAQQELQENEIEVLHGLAKCLNMSIVQLIVTWLPQVLAYALNQKDKRNLNSILEIYHAHAGLENKAILNQHFLPSWMKLYASWMTIQTRLPEGRLGYLRRSKKLLKL